MTVVQMYYNHAVAVGLGLLLLVQSGMAQAKPESVVDRASARVSAYLTELADVTCTEHVSQEKLAPNGKMEFHQESTFDYLVMMDGNQDEFTLNESRLPKQQSVSSKNLPLLVTNGFSTLFLIFHSYYRDAFTFSAGNETVENGHTVVPVRFVHITGKRTPIALAVRGREYPLDLEGTAWVDADSGIITRIQAGLAAPMDDISLRTLLVQVNYAPLKLGGADDTVQYPSSAYVEVQTRKQHWRNIHLFTNYKRFGVSTEVAVSGTKQ
ncbi:MAG TPA: hypothetical protein VF135_09375 [Terriglobales bacterium]